MLSVFLFMLTCSCCYCIYTIVSCSQDPVFLMLNPRRCNTSSVGQSAGLLIFTSSVRFWQIFKKTDNSDLHEFELHRPSNKGTKLLLQIMKAAINQCFDIALYDCVQFLKLSTFSCRYCMYEARKQQYAATQ